MAVGGYALGILISAIGFAIFPRCWFEGSFNEVLTVSFDTNKKEVAKSFKKILLELQIRVPAAYISSYMGRFCSQLGLGFRERVAAEQLASAVCPKRESRSTTLICFSAC